MKLIHISDIHINARPILNTDPVENFAHCLAHVENNHMDAERVVITGDLTHHGFEENYRTLKQMLAESRLQGDLEPRLLIGNHDNRAAFRSVFDAAPVDDNGFVQWSEATPAGRFVYLDTHEPGTHAGHLCQARRSWLDAELSRARDNGEAVWLFLHHNPISVHVANADIIGIVQEAELVAILSAHAETIRHIFFGHCHFTLSGSVVGIPYSAPRSTNHPCWPEFSGDQDVMAYGDLDPNYNVCFLSEKGVVVHSIDFLQEDRLNWLRLDGNGWLKDRAMAG